MTDIVERLKAYELFGNSVALTYEAAACIELLRKDRDKFKAGYAEACERITAHERPINALTKERDAWKSMQDDLYYLPLAAAQAQIVQLREVMLAVLCNPDGVPCFEGSDGDRAVIAEALALPADTGALDARLAQERERCVKACEAVEVHDVGHPGTAFTVQGLCISAIRSLT